MQRPMNSEILKLVGEDDRLGLRACIPRAERRAAANQNQPLAAYWRRTLVAARGRTEQEQGSQLEPNTLEPDRGRAGWIEQRFTNCCR